MQEHCVQLDVAKSEIEARKLFWTYVVSSLTSGMVVMIGGSTVIESCEIHHALSSSYTLK